MLSSLFDRLTRASVRFYAATIFFAWLILLLGFFAVRELNQDLLPRVELPRTIVVVTLPNAKSAQQVADAVTLPLENELRALPGIVNVESNTNGAVAALTVRNEFGLNQARIVNQIQQAIARAQLPDAANVQVFNFNPSDLPVVVVAATSKQLPLAELKTLAQNEIAPQLQNIPQVQRVVVRGGQELPTPAPKAVVRVETKNTANAQAAKLVPWLEKISVERASQITPDLLPKISAALILLTPNDLKNLPPETLARLPENFLQTLSPALRAELDARAKQFGGAGNLAANLSATPFPNPLPTPEPLAIPQSWMDAAASAGRTAKTSKDIIPRAMDLVNPRLLNDLSPELWRQLDPETIAVAFSTDPIDGKQVSKLERGNVQLDALLIQQLKALVRAGKGISPPPAVLPSAWANALLENGIVARNTNDITPELMRAIVWVKPALLDELSNEQLLAFAAATLSALPDDFVKTRDAGMQQTLQNIGIWHTRFLARAFVPYQVLGNPASEFSNNSNTPIETNDNPARLPEKFIEGARIGGFEIEKPQDISPEMLRTLNSFGRTGVEILQLLTPQNVLDLQPEVIALLPSAYLDTLNPTLRAQLDERAKHFGGAGALAKTETSTVHQDPNAPLLAGIWTEPPSPFRTASDLLQNPLKISAAEFLNRLPDTARVANPAAFLSALTPDVLQYLAAHEQNFAKNLSPITLELLSTDALTYLLENFPDAFDAAARERLQSIAAGSAAPFVPQTTIARTNGNPSILINVFRDPNANTVAVSERVFDALKQMQNQNSRVEFFLVFEQATLIQDSIRAVTTEGLLGAGFTIIVILIFLSGMRGKEYKIGWRATLVTAISIPLSILFALVLMRWLPPTIGAWLNGLAAANPNPVFNFLAVLFPAEMTLNLMTLSGLTVAIGRVVDDAIVVHENTIRHMQLNENPRDAAITATNEVARAIFTSTATTIAVFLPLGFIGGVIGTVFMPFALAATYALIGSFIIAITVVPTLAYLVVRQKDLPDLRETFLQKTYSPLLQWSLQHRALTLLGAALFFGASLFALLQLPRTFIPSFGEPTVNVVAQLPSRTRLADTDAQVRAFENKIAQLAGVRATQTEIGTDGGFNSLFGGDSVRQNVANVSLALKDTRALQNLTDQVRPIAEATFGQGNVMTSGAQRAGFSGFSLILSGDDSAVLRGTVNEVKETLAQIDTNRDGKPDIVNIASNVDKSAGTDTLVRINEKPSIRFTGEIENANTLGVTNAASEAVSKMPTLPAGVVVSQGVDSLTQTQGFSSVLYAILLSIGIVYAIMALTFRSLLQPLAILLSLPFAFIGAALALYFTHSALGISALIGLLMLVGIVVTNCIVLLELVNQLRDQNKSVFDALVQGGRTRLRPILMTALTTILALTPLALNTVGGTIIASEMAITVIGGLALSTLVSLIVVPVAYSLIARRAKGGTGAVVGEQ